jgi:hypothetical protein
MTAPTAGAFHEIISQYKVDDPRLLLDLGRRNRLFFKESRQIGPDRIGGAARRAPLAFLLYHPPVQIAKRRLRID